MPRPLRLSDIPAALTAEAFWILFGNLEHEQLDFKQGPPSDMTAILSAMSMTDGGLVVLGVSDDRQIAGCGLSQALLDKVMKAAHACGLEVQLREVQVAGRPVTIVAVPEVRGRIVTTPDGRLLRRVGSDNQPLVGDAMARFVRQREERSAEEETLPVVEPGDFDLKLVNAALARDGRPASRREGLVRALIDLGVAFPSSPPSGPSITRAAALLFSREPTKYVPGAVVQAVRRTGVGPSPGVSKVRQQLTGPLPMLLESVLEFIRGQTGRYEVVVGTRREILSEYPEPVLREAVLNALAHRDYGLTGATVDVTVWDDRIEIRSPGPLPGHITLDNIRDEHYSRNRRVMQVLKLLGLVEEYGEGIDRMYGEMEARLMEPPVFTATASSVTVVLHNRFLVDVEDQFWLALLGQYDLSPPERRLLVLARREEGTTPRRLRQVLPGIDASELLATAVAKGLLVRVGQAGGARYVLSDEVVVRAGASGLEAQSRKRQMLLDEIRRRGSLSTAEGAELIGEDSNMVRHLLNDLVRAGALIAHGRTRGRRYYPTAKPGR
jgi:ATP-dependent DNA helicase RecG